MKTHSQLLQDWLDDQRDNHGLIDFKFSLAEDAVKNGATLDSVAKELLEMIHAPALPDPELF